MNFLGIPEQADIANTFYSQFEEDFTPSDSDEDEQAQTVIRRKTGDSDDDADVMFGSDGASQIDTEVTLTKKDDEDELYNHLQYVLDKNEDAGDVLVTINVLKLRPLFSLFLNKMLVIRAAIHKMIVRIANREDPDQAASSEAALSGSAQFVRTFCQVTSV